MNKITKYMILLAINFILNIIGAYLDNNFLQSITLFLAAIFATITLYKYCKNFSSCDLSIKILLLGLVTYSLAEIIDSFMNFLGYRLTANPISQFLFILVSGLFFASILYFFLKVVQPLSNRQSTLNMGLATLFPLICVIFLFYNIYSYFEDFELYTVIIGGLYVFIDFLILTYIITIILSTSTYYISKFSIGFLASILLYAMGDVAYLVGFTNPSITIIFSVLGSFFKVSCFNFLVIIFHLAKEKHWVFRINNIEKNISNPTVTTFSWVLTIFPLIFLFLDLIDLVQFAIIISTIAIYQVVSYYNSMIVNIKVMRKQDSEIIDLLNKRIESKTKQLEYANKSLNQKAYTDTLTGLYNRYYLSNFLKDNKDLGLNFSIIYIDLDDFKTANDVYGHTLGDKILVTISERIKNSLPSTTPVIRLGGDEFVILIKTNDEKILTNYARNLIDIVKTPIKLGKLSFSFLISIGIASSSLKMNNISFLLKNAEAAMYSSKKKTTISEKITIYNPDNVAGNSDRFIDIEFFNSNLYTDFELKFKPIVNLSDGGFAGVKISCIWNRKKRGKLSYDKLLTILEGSDRMTEFYTWFFASVALKLSSWYKKYGVFFPFQIEVPVQILNITELEYRVNSIFKNEDIPINLLRLQFNEGDFAKFFDTIVDTVDDLQKIDINIVLSDFGAKGTDFAKLKQINFSHVQISREFTNEETSTPLLPHINKIAKVFSSRTIIEDITEKQKDILVSSKAKLFNECILDEPLNELNFELKYLKT